MSLHNYSFLLSIHVATRPQNEAERLGEWVKAGK
jgi:hypothetical protein